ncbi:MAG: rRNA maturation RNase YbeY [Rickettsiales bacterium]|jgi:probable rRNA maturation factor|nr:rRNA maturation RNase YbeY [Rickettsiales bacterium]
MFWPRRRIGVSFAVESPKWADAVPDAEKIALRAARAAFKAAGTKVPRGAEVSVLLTDDKGIRKLNRLWRGKDRATNVLAFETGDDLMPGDIALSIDTLVREAKAQGTDLRAHLAHLAAHGALHLLGFDHIDADDADEMEFYEKRILREMGFRVRHIPD